MRKEAIEKLSLSLNVSSDTVLRQLSRYWQSGNRPESLAGKASNSGQTHESHMHKKAIGGQKATSDHHVNKVLQSQDFENMHTVIMEYYARPVRSTIPDAFHELLNRYYTDADAPDGYSPDRPSLTQFSHYFYDMLSTEDKASIEMKRLGKKGAPLKGRAYFGTLSEAYYGYGDCCMLDATELDLELCYRYNTQERIGRAVLFYGIDVVTTQIPMVYLGIKSEGQYGARMLILCGLTDKVAFCRRYGVDIKEEDWPGSPYLPHCIYCDNSEMRGTFMDSFVTSLGVSVTNTLFNRGDLKSLVERHFHETLLRLGYIHGKVDKAYKDNTGRDYVKEAVLTIPDAWKIILSITVKYNQHRAVPFRGRPDWLEEKVTPTPNELAKWCMHNSTGRLRTLDPLLVNASMLPESSAEITPTDLIFHGLQYIPENEKDDAEFILARKHWKKRSRTHQPDKLTVHYDPNMISMIYRIIPGQKEPAVYHLSSVDELTFGNMSLVEVLLLLEIRNKQLADQREQDELHKAQIKKEIHETENQAKKRVKDHGRQYGKNGKITKHAQRVEQTLQYLDDLVMIQQEHLADHLLSLLENNPALSEQLDDTQPPNLADT